MLIRPVPAAEQRQLASGPAPQRCFMAGAPRHVTRRPCGKIAGAGPIGESLWPGRRSSAWHAGSARLACRRNAPSLNRA